MKKHTPLIGGGIAAAVTLSLLAPVAAIADDAAPVIDAPVAEAPVVEAPIAEAPVSETIAVETAVEAPVAETAVEAPTEEPVALAPETTEIVAAEASPATESRASAPTASVAPVAEASALIAGRSTVTFAITDLSGAPVVNANVHAVSRITNTIVASALTSTDGTAVLDDLEFGEYQFVVEEPLGRNDLDGAWLGGTYSGDATIVTIAYASPTSFAVQLPATDSSVGAHRVSGRVTNTAGDPIAGAQVFLFNIVTTQQSGTAFTDLDGYYLITGVGDGEFIVVTQKLSGQGSSELYYPGYFGGLTEADADPLHFDAASTDATGIDIQTGMFGAEGIVHVRVTDPWGAPIPNARVRAFDSSGAMVVETRADSRGDAEFEDLSADEEYEFRVDPPGASALSSEAFTHVVAPQREVTVPVQLGFGSLDANDDEYTFEAGSLFDSSVAAGVRANDTPGDQLHVELLTAPSYGSQFELDEDGRFTYFAADGFDGLDSFTYRLVGPDGLVSGSTTVRLDITDDEPVAPVAVDDVFETALDTALVVDAPGVLANDIEGGYPLVRVYQVVQDAAHGSLVVNPDGSFVYTPDPGFTGTDAFQYNSEDGVSLSEPATVTITVGSAVSAGDAPADSPRTGGLAFTGAGAPWLAGLAGAVVLGAGAVLTAVTRRRRDA